MKVAVMGGSGYIGGELVRLLLGHPDVELTQVSSNRLANRPLSLAHPNLRGQKELRFCRHDEIGACDALFLTTPHGTTRDRIEELDELAPLLFDLSADFRLTDPAAYEAHYGSPHPRPEWLSRFTLGLPEVYRDQLRSSTRVAVPGCMATAGALALYPLAAEGWVEGAVTLDARTGSSGSGATASPANHHAERSGAMRVFKPAGHRHQAEIRQICGVDVLMTATGVEAVRGIQVLARVTLIRKTQEQDLWRIFRKHYAGEPFVRIVKQRGGIYKLPEPKLLSGTNWCDVGFALWPDGRHLTAVAAIDNLVKGGAGNAVQSFNIIRGLDERTALGFPGLHPI